MLTKRKIFSKSLEQVGIEFEFAMTRPASVTMATQEPDSLMQIRIYKEGFFLAISSK